MTRSLKRGVQIPLGNVAISEGEKSLCREEEGDRRTNNFCNSNHSRLSWSQRFSVTDSRLEARISPLGELFRKPLRPG